METNTILFLVLAIALIAFIYFLIKQNKKDQKNVEKSLNEQNNKPERHDGPHV